MEGLRSMTWDALIQAYYHGDPAREPSKTDALREEIRRRVDALRDKAK